MGSMARSFLLLGVHLMEWEWKRDGQGIFMAFAVCRREGYQALSFCSLSFSSSLSKHSSSEAQIICIKIANSKLIFVNHSGAKRLNG